MSLAQAKHELKAAGDTINAELYNIPEAAPFTPQDDQKVMLLGEALRYINQAFDCLVAAEKVD